MGFSPVRKSSFRATKVKSGKRKGENIPFLAAQITAGFSHPITALQEALLQKQLSHPFNSPLSPLMFPQWQGQNLLVIFSQMAGTYACGTEVDLAAAGSLNGRCAASVVYLVLRLIFNCWSEKKKKTWVSWTSASLFQFVSAFCHFFLSSYSMKHFVYWCFQTSCADKMG